MESLWEVDRDGVERAMVAMMTASFQDQVTAGEWTQAQADQAIGAFMRSPALQEAVTAEVERLDAVMNKRLH